MYCVFLTAIGFFPYFLGMTGIVSAIVVALCALYFTYTAIKLYITQTDKAALQVMFASFIYLPVVLIALVIDKI